MRRSIRLFTLIFVLTATLLVGLLPTSALAAETRETVGAFEVTGGTSGTDYSYTNGVLTVNSGANITISMANGATATTSGRIRIVVNGNAKITLNGVNITPEDADTGEGYSGIDLASGATLNITLQSGSSNEIHGGKSETGMPGPGIHVPEGSTLTIGGEGSLEVQGASREGSGAVGIGGKGSSLGAGEACGNVLILGGTITVQGGTPTVGGNTATDIGGGQGSPDGGNGQGIRPVSGQTNTYTVWGSLELPCDITIPEGATVTIPDGASLTVPEDTTLTNNGTILVQGGNYTNSGTLTGNPPTYPSTVTVSFSQGGQAVTSVPYGSTVTITATMEKAETAANALSADTGTVDFYLGAVEDGTKLNEDGVSVTQGSDGTCTATLEVTLDGENWKPSESPYTITADFGGYAPEGDESGDSLAPNTGSAELTVTKAEQSAPTGTFLPTSSTENSITVTFTDVTQQENENGIEIACAVGPTASEPTSDWTTAEKFNTSTSYNATIDELSPGTPYIFFARYKGDDTHEPSPATASSSAFYTKPKITTQGLPNAYVGVEYSKKLEAVAAEGVAVSWTITSGTLPAGLTLNIDGTITGTPTTPTTQAANFTVNATIGEGASSIFTTQVLTISVTKSDAELGGLEVSGQTGFEGAFQYGDTITVTFTPERKVDTSTNALAENTATLTYTSTEGKEVTLATATAQADDSFKLTYDTKKKELPIGENLTLTVSYGGSGALNPVEKELTVTLDQAYLKNIPTVTGNYVYGETLTVHYTKQDDETVSYQWYRSADKIPGATEASYTLTEADIGEDVYVSVEATDEWHYGAKQSRRQEVAKAQGSIEISCDSVTYGETVQPSVTSNTNTGADVTYSYAGTGSTSYSPSNEAPENAGTYTVTATVAETATHTAAESEPVAFTIRKASQTAPAAPTEARTTTSSITLNAISTNENGAAAEYGISKDGGKTWTWQSGPEFDDLSSNTTYQFAARYAETDNYAASDPSSVVSIATDRRSSGGGPSAPSGPSAEGGKGWDNVEDVISNAGDGETVTVDMNGETEVPGSIFEEVAGKDVTVEFDMGDVTWTVNGEDIPTGTELSGLDLGVSLGTSGISVDVINTVTGELGSVQITLAHDGEFGFALTLTAPLGRENAGYWANLYHYDEDAKALNFETSAQIDDQGDASLRMTHASQYAIVIDDRSHGLAFTDVSEGSWYFEYVQYVVSHGLMEGTSATTFEPEATMTRAMVWAVLARVDGEEISGAGWQSAAREWAVSNGVSDGTDPNGLVTREQFATMLHRYAGEPEASGVLDAFTDAASVSGWAREAMAWAVENGIVTGVTATTLAPQGTATRAQAAAMLMRFDLLGLH